MTHSVTLVLTVISVVVNGGFETGDLTGWFVQGTAAAVPGGHSGNSAAQVGDTSPTKDTSFISQSFMVPAAGGLLSFWYQVHCPDTLRFDWAVARIRDTVTTITTTILHRTCTNNGLWVQATQDLSASSGHIITLTLASHDDNFPGDATFTLYDDVALSPPPPPLQNGSFETGDLTGWSSAGTTAIVSGGHASNFGAMLGSTSPTNGDSSISQTFTAPAGATLLSVWFWETCPDTVAFDWARATLKDNTTGTTTVLISKQCQTTNGWVQAVTGLVGGHVYTLTLVSHDDNFSGDPTYTLYDDIVIQ